MENREIRRGARPSQPDNARRRLVAGYFVAALLAGAMVGAILVIATTGGGEEAPETPPGAPFGPHYEGLEQRRHAAGVPTMAEGGGEHFHPQLQVFADGEEIAVPANIGIDPARPPTEMAGLHTHDDSGTIHNEAGSGATLSDFFAIWGVPFSERELGPHDAAGSKTVRMWVDGQPSQEFGDLELEDGQEIVIAYGPKDSPAPPGLGE
jgi:hypothetical protein